MQCNRNMPNFRQFNLISRNRAFFKLWKQKRLELSVLFESRKPNVSLTKILPSIMKAFNYVLQHLRMNALELCPGFFEYGKLSFLLHVSRKRDICTDDVFLLQGTSINHALTTIHPIFKLSQGIVVNPATTFKPIKHLNLKACIWINSVREVHGQHCLSLAQLSTCAKFFRETTSIGCLRSYGNPP